MSAVPPFCGLLENIQLLYLHCDMWLEVFNPAHYIKSYDNDMELRQNMKIITPDNIQLLKLMVHTQH